MPNSIRWRLSLTYAGIALLTALALGLALLAILRGYYAQREQEYLLGNARTISAAMAKLMAYEDLSAGFLQSQVEGFAFLSQVRVRVTDPDARLIADSGTPNERNVIFTRTLSTVAADPAEPPKVPIRGTAAEGGPVEAPLGLMIVAAAPAEGSSLAGVTVLRREELAGGPLDPLTLWAGGQRHSVPAGSPEDVVTLVPGVNTIYGFEMAFDERTPAGPRSDQAVSEPFYDADGRLRGYVELSEGPAYGRDIVASVAWGWALAGSVAMVLAAVVGWLVSRRISAPLLALEATTSRMAAGDLSARAEASRRDEIGALARSFNQMAAQVEKTVSALRRFVADAAHELHTPLTALQTNLELAATGADAEERTDLISRAQAQVLRLEQLTNALLDLSRAEAAPRAERTAVDLVSLAREAGEVFASRAEQAGISLNLELAAATPIVEGNEAQLQRLLGNLLDNALKFTPAGGTVILGVAESEGGTLLTVRDSGIGIPADELPLLFSRFHRARNAAGHPGSGLGLTIVKAIAEAHSGRVWAESDAKGSCFACWLPLCCDAAGPGR